MSFLDEVEFRPIKTSERREFFNLERYVFADERKLTEEDEAADPLRPEMTTVAFHKGRIIATSGGFPFRLKLNGNTIRADGVTSVGTDPQYRRRGLVRRMISIRFEQAYENNVSASILWATLGAIYQRFGYGLASSAYKCKFDPRFCEFQFDEPEVGFCVRTDRNSSVPILKDLHEQYIADTNLQIHRHDVFWQRAYLDKKCKLHVAIHYDEKGRPDGFVSYRLSESREKIPGPNQKISIRDFFALNRAAYRSLWNYIRSHDLVISVEMWMPTDDPAFLMLLEPRQLQAEWAEGLWLRAVDVKKLAGSRPYPNKAKVAFAIPEDRECPWNVGTYLLDTDGISSTVTTTNQSADFRIDINGFGTLLSGHNTLSELEACGRAAILNRDREHELNSTFATKHRPFCNDGF
ncbi:MAG: GNAT family N-acetyltransferase [Gammaproteobacteria bacterium]|nr:GNAT family N-acetyltransferase [Gammaproteobacteria bacterium]MYF37567.1 GNAT family N-acetyltransferase [Gammaproteobacteria bacterium]